jgi:aspartate/methionine/tyrosine aminotransferase
MIPAHIKKIKSFIAMDILEELERRRAAGRPVISFSLGEPDLPPPEGAKAACIEALEGDFTKYTNSQGLLELRQEIARHYQKKYNVSVDPEQIIVTGGTSPAMLLAFSVLLGAGDEVILSNPHYPCYPAFVEYLRGKPVFVKVREEDSFQYRPSAIAKKIGKKTRAILINSPSNPTGYLMDDQTMKEISGFAEKNRWIVSDEIYHELVYEGKDRSILEFTDRAFVINGFSKAYAMTGFRLGFLIAPKPFIPTLKILQQNFFISANSFVQKAGIAALQEGEAYLKNTRKVFNERRLAMLEGVKRLGFGVTVPPTGAFYIFANAKKLTKDSYRFAMDLLDKTDVGVTPGVDFGSEGEGYLRFSYANSLENIEEGLRRIGRHLKA